MKKFTAMILAFSVMPVAVSMDSVTIVNEQQILDQELLNAAESGDFERTKKAIDSGASVNAKDPNGGFTALHATNDLSVAQLLISSGANVSARDQEGLTPLHTVDNANVTQLLIENGADVNAKDTKGQTPLHTATSTAAANMLIAAGADVNAQSNSGLTPLHAGGAADTLLALIDSGADINAKNKNVQTPLQYQSQKRRYSPQGRNELARIREALIDAQTYYADLTLFLNNPSIISNDTASNFLRYLYYRLLIPEYENYLVNISNDFIERNKLDEFNTAINILNKVYAEDTNQKRRLKYATLRQGLQQLAFAKKIGKPGIRELYK